MADSRLIANGARFSTVVQQSPINSKSNHIFTLSNRPFFNADLPTTPINQHLKTLTDEYGRTACRLRNDSNTFHHWTHSSSWKLFVVQ
jgi:hypothetical protein